MGIARLHMIVRGGCLSALVVLGVWSCKVETTEDPAVSGRDAGSDATGADASVDSGVSDGAGQVETGSDAIVPSSKMVLHGTASQSSDAKPVAQAEVRASADRNKDGQISADEVVSGVSGADGTFRLEVPVSPKERVVVRFKAAGMAPALRVVTGNASADVALDVVLAAMPALTCSGTQCESADKGIRLAGLPDGSKASAVAFSPSTDADKFPGEFRDSSGDVLVSGGFASIQATDSQGQEISKLPQAATLTMEVSKDVWGIVNDIKPGNDRIDVPMYSFDEIKGVWNRETDGHLVDTDGYLLPETDLESIRGGQFSKAVFVKASVSHFSYWNLDWPIETHGCVTGTVQDESGKPASGATVYAGGVDYTATFSPMTTGSDGRFCLDVMRAEGAEEDFDFNGVKGDKHLLMINLGYMNKLYVGGQFSPGAKEASCDVGCADIGALVMSAKKERKAAIEGHWAGDWGNMVLRRIGTEYWGAYTHDQGTVVMRSDPDGVFRGWWSEAPRQSSSDSGEMEFRFSWSDTGVLMLDGRWKYGVDDSWREDWDLQHADPPEPQELVDRFNDATVFVRHP